MGLKEQFLSFVEYYRSAEELLHRKGPNDNETIKTFEKTNNLKRDILNQLEALERPRETTPIDRNYKWYKDT